MKQPKRKIKDKWKYVLERIFGSVGVVHITQYSAQKGVWKLGKTDVSLFIAECLQHYGTVRDVATNIFTFDHLPHIHDLVNLKNWLYSNRRTKLYIFDEMNVHAPKRRPMSNMNVGILKIFPEISKARARLICIGQDLLGIDKEMIKDIWTRGLFIKRTLRTVEVNSHLLPRQFTFRECVPPTSIPFDPYEVAPFTEKPDSLVFNFKDDNLKLLYEYANGDLKQNELLKREGLQRTQFHRILKRYLARTLPMFEQLNITTESDTIQACVMYRNGSSLNDIKDALKLSHPEEAKRLIIQGLDELLKASDVAKFHPQPFVQQRRGP